MAAVLPASPPVLDGDGETEVPLAATVSDDVPEVAGEEVPAEDAVPASAGGVLAEEAVVEEVTLSDAVDGASTCLLQAARAALTASTNASFFMEFLSR
jgi:hypothetical protein